MKSKTLLIVLALLAAAALGVVIMQNRKQDSARQTKPPVTETASQTQRPSAPVSSESDDVPAHYKVAPALTELRPVLASSQFTGKAREAYDAVRDLPDLIAQMPCYCHCDRGMGHKSLHSCYEDDHAAHCAVCVDEALMAYQLQKKGLSASEIREQIIVRFSGD